MTITTGMMPELLWPGIKAIYGDAYADYQPLYPQFVQVDSSDKAYEKYQGITGFGLAAVKDEGSSITYRDMFQGGNREIINTTYALGAQITMEMMLYDQYNKINRVPELLARSMRATEETVAANLLNNGFGTVLTDDGLSLFNTAHTKVNASSTYANRPLVATDISQAAIEQAYIDIGNFTDDSDIPIVARPKALIVPIENQFEARKILDTEYEVASADNTINPVSKANYPIQLIVNPYLTDPDAWFMVTDVPNGLIMTKVVVPNELDRDNNFDSKNLHMSVVSIFGTGAANARGAYGSPGA